MVMVSDHERDEGALRKRVLRRIRSLRLLMGLSQMKMACRVGMTQSTYSRFERGKIATDIETVTSVARALNIDLKTLICPEEDLSDLGDREGDEEPPVGSSCDPSECFRFMIEEIQARIRDKEEIIELLRTMVYKACDGAG